MEEEEEGEADCRWQEEEEGEADCRQHRPDRCFRGSVSTEQHPLGTPRVAIEEPCLVDWEGQGVGSLVEPADWPRPRRTLRVDLGT